ncbi:MAG: winged helix-turn-helix domain-containing protein [Nanoarchaeota archaeon]
MADEPFLLVSLKESEAKKLAQVISNDTCRRILDELSHGDATETQLSKQLKQPISTIHYNLKHLLDAKLVQIDEFHYSEKGKEVNHYKLSNKYVIIAPKEASETFRQKLKKLLPIVGITAGLALIIQFFNRFTSTSQLFATYGTKASAPAAEELARDLVAPSTEKIVATPLLAQAGEQVAENFTNTTTELINQTTTITSQPLISEQNIALWFFIGALVTLILVFIFYRMTNERIGKKK